MLMPLGAQPILQFLTALLNELCLLLSKGSVLNGLADFKEQS